MKKFKLEYLITPAIIIGGLGLIKLFDKLSNGAVKTDDILIYPSGVSEDHKVAILREYNNTMLFVSEADEDYDRHYYKTMCRKIRTGKYKVEGDELTMTFKDIDGDEVEESIDL